MSTPEKPQHGRQRPTPGKLPDGTVDTGPDTEPHETIDPDEVRQTLSMGQDIMGPLPGSPQPQDDGAEPERPSRLRRLLSRFPRRVFGSRLRTSTLALVVLWLALWLLNTNVNPAPEQPAGETVAPVPTSVVPAPTHTYVPTTTVPTPTMTPSVPETTNTIAPSMSAPESSPSNTPTTTPGILDFLNPPTSASPTPENSPVPAVPRELVPQP